MNLKPLKANMTEVSTDKAVILFSYSTPVACCINGEDYYRTSKKWSATTSRHINQWLDGVKAQEKPQEFFDNLA